RKNLSLIRQIFKQSTPFQKSIGYDFFLGVSTWIISFPIVTILGELLDYFIIEVFQYSYKEQVAVRYLKAMQNDGLLLSLALFAILILAPIIEEFLFRGVLQNAFKKSMGYKAAILLSSFSFALFHYSPSQGASNISL